MIQEKNMFFIHLKKKNMTILNAVNINVTK